jgi:hypothetical protein
MCKPRQNGRILKLLVNNIEALKTPEVYDV